MSDGSDTGAVGRFVDEIDAIPFAVGTALTLVFIAVAALATEWVSAQVTTAFELFGEGLAWLYLGSVLVLVVVGLYLMASPYGRIKLGSGDPEYGYASYVAMFFSAGLSAGIVFFGPVEALTHFDTVPPLFDAEPNTEAAMVPALAYSVFHYGVSAWGGYLAIGIPVAYYVYNDGAPFRVSTVLLPLVGEDGLDGVLGRTVDTLAVVATLGGIATGLGFIATQLLTGVTYRTGVEFGDAGTLVAIVAITVVFTVSLLAGVDRGIKRLSDFNVVVMLVLLAATAVLGPTLDVFNTGVAALGTYAGNFLSMSLFTGVGTDGGAGWASLWTVFYWSWWIAWAPFVGLFLARISKGRTIREVLFTGFVTMTGVSVVWFTVVGGTSMWLQHSGVADILGPVNEFGNGVAGYALFGALPLGELWSLLFLVLVVTFFATSADSSTLAVAMLTTGGKRRPSRLNRLFWGVLQGVIASVLVVLGGASALRSSVIVTGAPFTVVCLAAFGLFVVRLGRDTDSLVFSSGPADTDDRQPPAATEDD